MTAVLVDSHVHLHDPFDLASALRCAAANVALYARERGAGAAYQAVLCLTETARKDEFAEMARRAAESLPLRGDSVEWRFSLSEEAESLYADGGPLGHLIIVAGAQIVTAERLEVLALGTRRRIPDGEPILDVIRQVRAANAAAVVPWGFGKWIGRRARVVEALLADHGRTLLVGDNGNRLRFGPAPRAFAIASDAGVPIIPGSDPLPMAGEERRIGSYGFVLHGALDRATPARDLVARLRAADSAFESYGRRETAWRFVRNQVLMQRIKRSSS